MPSPAPGGQPAATQKARLALTSTLPQLGSAGVPRVRPVPSVRGPRASNRGRQAVGVARYQIGP